MSRTSNETKVVVASSIMLSFISFWRAAAIVLSDLASSAYYAGGIAENSIGKSAPWFILAIVLFGFAIRAIYVESSSMFVRGGVYRVVHEALGGALAKLSVSALMFDYVLTGPISAVSAGLYLAGLINETASYSSQRFHVASPKFAAGFAVLATIYFWRQNTIGIRESSDKALTIIKVTSVMVVILIIWCLLTVFKNGFQPVPLPTTANLHFGPDALGWLEGTRAPQFPPIAWLIGLGHSLLAMSGFETLAQVYREIEAPKLKNLRRASLVVILYSLLFTSSVSFFAVMLIPDAERPKYLDNLIGGVSMFLVGPAPLQLIFHAFVVLVGTLILAGAVNTAIIGSNGVLNRVAEDGVLPDWFREPHPRYGTTSRLINLIVALQIITIVLSRGDVNILGQAYAFGVVWSFTMKSFSVLVLRYKRPQEREWKTPLNFRIGGTEIPLGLILITATLFTLAVVNMLTKKTATIAGSFFTVALFLVFSWSERQNRRKRRQIGEEQEKFRLEERPLSIQDVEVRPFNILVEVRDPKHLDHLKRLLEEINPEKQELVAVAVHRLSPMASAEHPLQPDQVCSNREKALFSKVVNLAEAAGKQVKLLVVPARDSFYALVQSAQRLQSSMLVITRHPHLTPNELARRIGQSWQQLSEPRPALTLQILSENGEWMIYSLGSHPPRLWPQDVDLVHRLWMELAVHPGFGSQLHHRDVVSVALRRFDEQLHSPQATQALEDVRHEIGSGESS